MFPARKMRVVPCNPGLLLGVLLVVAVSFEAPAQITVRGQLAHDLETVPGATLTGSVIIDNETAELQ